MTAMTEYRPHPQSTAPCQTCSGPVHGHDRSFPKARLLTELDAAILQCLASGSSSVQISTQLHLSRQAVDYHIHAMLRAFNAGNRPGLISKAYSLGVLMIGCWPPKVTPECVR